ncbi:hypothetical protein F5141DRAFT_72598 [Pisolithus sp. B1]|nr:hypothetical protein F5141DRAFT_72598 [Pisolithus sp. B1]
MVWSLARHRRKLMPTRTQLPLVTAHANVDWGGFLQSRLTLYARVPSFGYGIMTVTHVGFNGFGVRRVGQGELVCSVPTPPEVPTGDIPWHVNYRSKRAACQACYKFSHSASGNHDCKQPVRVSSYPHWGVDWCTISHFPRHEFHEPSPTSGSSL